MMMRPLLVGAFAAALSVGGASASLAQLPTPPHPRCEVNPDSTQTKDTFDITHNVEGVDVLFLFSGRQDNGCTRRHSVNGRDFVEVENVHSDTVACRGGEVAMFPPGHRMQFAEAAGCFSDKPDLLTFDISPEPIQLPTTVWTVNFDVTAAQAAQRRIKDHFAFTNAVYTGAGCGVEFAIPTLKAGNADTLTCAGIKSTLGSDAGKVNVYYVASGLGVRGIECPDPNMIVIGDTGESDTLAHEFGHVLDLGHVNDSHNIMSTQAYGRNKITIGQCYIANLNNRSILQTRKLAPPPSIAMNCTGQPGGGGVGCPGAVCPTCRPASIADLWGGVVRAATLTPLLDDDAKPAGLPTPDAIQNWQDILTFGLSADVRAIRQVQLRDAYFVMKRYQAAHPDWQTSTTEAEYVDRGLRTTLASMQVRAVGAIQESGRPDALQLIDLARIRGLQFKTLDSGARMAIEAVLSGKK